MFRALVVFAAILACHVLSSGAASAQTPPSEDGVASSGAPKSPRDPADDIVEKLMTSDADEEDLRWLYSSADEYTPSELTGKPIPAPGLPQRGAGTPRSWNPRWRKFGVGNYVLTGGSLLAAAAASFVPATPSRWQSRNPFDEWGRRNLGVTAYERGLWARDLSDVLVSVNLAFPWLVDSLIVTSWYRRSSEVASEMALITTEAIAVSAAVQGLISSLTSRERPLGRDCGKSIDPRFDDCQNRDRYRSFFSGHASNAFASASVTCSHHARHDVFGDPFADGLTCGVAMVSAATVGTMRVVGQRHYLSDVLTGAAVGTLSGFGVPWLLHYGGSTDGEAEIDAATLSLLPLPNGLAVGGWF